jgi:predicted SprT family Zn-dependent metalloprotease
MPIESTEKMQHAISTLLGYDTPQDWDRLLSDIKKNRDFMVDLARSMVNRPTRTHNFTADCASFIPEAEGVQHKECDGRGFYRCVTCGRKPQ